MTSAPPPFVGDGKKLQVGCRIFRSPTHLSETVRGLLHSQEPYVPFSGADHQLLTDWCRYHPDATAKRGVGIAHFYVGIHCEYGAPSRALFIRRIDGTPVDISYKEPSRALVQLFKNQSLARNPFDKVGDLKNALRLVVEDQCVAVKRVLFSRVTQIRCPVSGSVITMTDAATDHVYPMTFDAIAWHWAMINRVRADQIEVADLGMRRKLVDESLCDSFSRFHRNTANLRVISKRANNSLPKYPCDWNATAMGDPPGAIRSDGADAGCLKAIQSEAEAANELVAKALAVADYQQSTIDEFHSCGDLISTAHAAVSSLMAKTQAATDFGMHLPCLVNSLSRMLCQVEQQRQDHQHFDRAMLGTPTPSQIQELQLGLL